jgi:hypothetical protein
MVAAAVIGGAVIGGVASNMAANKESGAANNAANAQLQAANSATAEQRREYDQTRSDQLPFLQAGYGALDKENALLNGDYSGFENSPDYQFSLNQEIGAVDKSAASHGSLFSGGHDQDLMNYAGGLADQYLNSYWNKLAGQAGQGQVSASNLASAGANEANNIGNYMTNAGDARASSYLQQGNIGAQQIGAWGNAAGNILGYYTNGAGSTGASNPYSGFNINTGDYSQFTNPNVSSWYGG